MDLPFVYQIPLESLLSNPCRLLFVMSDEVNGVEDSCKSWAAL